jgi:hypothetical protein
MPASVRTSTRWPTSAVPTVHPAGVPTGGQFAPASRPEASGIELSDEDLVEVVGEGDARTMPELEPEEGLTINLSAELIDRCGNTFRRGMFGPEGFTIDAAPALQRFTSQRYVPHAYREFGTGAPHVNGAMGGLFYFSGVDGESAAELLATLPSKCLDNRQNDAPTLRNILSAARDHPKVLFGGYVVGPDRTDERVSADTVFFDTDDKTEEDVRRRVRALFRTRANPDEVMRSPAPGHPSKEVWRVWWD